MLYSVQCMVSYGALSPDDGEKGEKKLVMKTDDGNKIETEMNDKI